MNSSSETASGAAGPVLGVVGLGSMGFGAAVSALRKGVTTIGLDPSGEERGMTGATPFFEVADLSAALAEMKAAGCDIAEDVKAVDGARTVAMVSDSDGSMIGLMHTE